MCWELQSGCKTVDQIPAITVVRYNGRWLTVDNRRLYVFKRVYDSSTPCTDSATLLSALKEEEHIADQANWREAFGEQAAVVNLRDATLELDDDNDGFDEVITF